MVEVADSSLDYDRGVKLQLYARAGIPEVWLVDVAGASVEVCRRPAPDGYRATQQLGRGEILTCEALTMVAVPVDDIVGQP